MASDKPPHATLMERATSAHRRGERDVAEALYREALKSRPQDAYVMYLLGALQYESHRYALALNWLEQSVSVDPSQLPARSMLGAAFAAVGRFDQAVDQFRYVADCSPRSTSAAGNLARAYIAARQPLQAEAILRSALNYSPNDPTLLGGLGQALLMLGRATEAIEPLQRVTQLQPNDDRAKVAWAGAMLDAGRHDEAVAILESIIQTGKFNRDAVFMLGRFYYRQLLLVDAEKLFRTGVGHVPGDAPMMNYLGAVLFNLGRTEEAQMWIEKAYSSDPRDAEVVANLGLIHQAKGKTESAIQYFQQALQINPRFPECLNNLGVSLQAADRWDEALSSYDQALSLQPEFHGARSNKGQALLFLGRLAEGWPEYSHRFDQKILATERREFPYPKWEGADDRMVRLLLWTDQGLGDEILYLSMLSDAVNRVGICMVECSPRLRVLVQRSFPNVGVVPRAKPADAAIAEFRPTHQLSLPELGRIFRPDLQSFPTHAGYLKSEPRQTETLRMRYQALAGDRKVVGVSWRSENARLGQFKSIALPLLAKLIKATNVFPVSLQYGNVEADLADLRSQHGVDIYADRSVDPIVDPDASAAQISAMDLVLTTSNTTAHFAGALGVPVWTLLPRGPGALWYWFAEGARSPWYPSMTIFRQHRPGDWDGVIDQAAQAFRDWGRA